MIKGIKTLPAFLKACQKAYIGLYGLPLFLFSKWTMPPDVIFIKVFQSVSCFTYQVILLLGYCINKEIRSYLLAGIKLHTQGIKLHTILIFLHTGRQIVTARLREAGRLCMTTYRNLHCYILPINRAFQSISCFTSLFTLLSGYGINKGFYSYIPIKILLHTISIFLHTIWK